MEKTHWKKVFNSEYLGSCDLEDGKDIKATIKTVVVKKVKNTSKIFFIICHYVLSRQVHFYP